MIKYLGNRKYSFTCDVTLKKLKHLKLVNYQTDVQGFLLEIICDWIVYKRENSSIPMLACSACP